MKEKGKGKEVQESQSESDSINAAFADLSDADEGLYGNYDKLANVFSYALYMFQLFTGGQKAWLIRNVALFTKYTEYQFLVHWLLIVAVSAPAAYALAAGKVTSFVGQAKMKYLSSFLGDLSSIARNLLIFAYLALVGWKQHHTQLILASISFLITAGLLIWRKILKWKKILHAYKEQQKLERNPEKQEKREDKEAESQEYAPYEDTAFYGSAVTLLLNYAFAAQSKLYNQNFKLLTEFPQYSWVIVIIGYTATIPSFIKGGYYNVLGRELNERNGKFFQFLEDIFSPLRSGFITLYLLLIQTHLKQTMLLVSTILFAVATGLSAFRAIKKWKYYYLGEGKNDYEKWKNLPKRVKENKKQK